MSVLVDGDGVGRPEIVDRFCCGDVKAETKEQSEFAVWKVSQVSRVLRLPDSCRELVSVCTSLSVVFRRFNFILQIENNSKNLSTLCFNFEALR